MPSLALRPRLRPRRAGMPLPGEPPPPAETFEPDVVTGAGIRWLHIERPRDLHREWLIEQFDFHDLAIEDVASRNQRPKLDVFDDYLFLILHFPVFDKPTKRLLLAELDMFVGQDYLITLSDQPIPAIDNLFARYGRNEDVREAVMSKGAGYLLYRIVDTGVDASFPMLRRMGDKLDVLEDQIFEGGHSSEIVRDISEAKQEIINFRRIIRPMRPVLRDLERTKGRYLAPDLEIYFDDITDAVERIWDVLENYKEVVEALEDTNESVLSHRLNSSLRVLTAFSVAMLPLTLLASIFGMNVALPGSTDSPLEFWVILAIMVLTLVAVLAFFRRRGFL